MGPASSPSVEKYGSGRGGYVYYLPPIVTYQLEQLPQSKGLVLWIIEGHILDRQEVEYLTVLPSLEPRLKVVVEMGASAVFAGCLLADTLVLA